MTLHRATVDRLPRPSAAARQRWADHPVPSAAVHAEAVGELGVFDAVEVGPDAPTVAVDRLRIAAFNVERGRHADECGDLLASVDADVVLLSEVDVGMARSGQRHVAEHLAHRLGLQSRFAVEFVELGPGGPEEVERVGDEANEVGFHGGAVLSRVPVTEVAVLRLELDGGWYGARPEGVPVEPRIGGRIAVLAVVECAGTEVVVAAPHLESHGGAQGRAEQLAAVLDAVDDLRPGAPAVVGGDLNTTTLEPVHFADPARLAEALGDGPERFVAPRSWEPLFEMAEERGYRWLGADPGQGTARVSPDLPPTMRLDWFCVRGVDAGEHRVVPAIGPDGGPVSDHELLVVDSVQPVQPVAPRAS